MGTIKTKGIVIAENNMGDFDKMLTILTPDLGKIGCAARGARRQKSALLAGSQFLCFSDYVLYSTPNSYIMNSCETIELFYNIRIDLEKLEYAAHITKIINDVTTENQNNYKVLQLYLNTLYAISETDKDLNFILTVFKIKLLSIIGFYPIIKHCANCKTEENLSYFSIKDNGLKCKICGNQDKSAIQISENTRTAIQYIIMKESKKIFSFSMPEASLKELEIIAKIYMNEKLEKEYKM